VAAEVFALVADQLAGVQSVPRVDVPARPSVFLFEVRHAGRERLMVAWDRRDPFSGRTNPWSLSIGRGRQIGHVIDALGEAWSIEAVDGHIALPISVTPIFVSAA
jgi:hypothetical protein